ncbi:MAG TPA: FHA domain-containing protein [Terriglobales bacterium]|nr:FHA domain-containing protein [Terriglobales bacterium]
MDHSATKPAVASGGDIILEVVRNMREGVEPLHYTTLAPAIYRVYLHPDDAERLRAIESRIVEEAKRALDEEVTALNRTSFLDRLGSRKSLPKVTAPEHGWHIELHENTDDDAQPGDILIESELALPQRPDFGAGSLTRRIATRRIQGVEGPTRKFDEPVSPGQQIYAIIRFEDNRGSQVYRMAKNQIVIGRGGQAYWTDLRLETLPDVSREHVRLRRDPDTGKFFIKDLSRLGSTVDGSPVASSIEYVGGEKRDKNLEVPLPPRARIGLAGVVFLDFEAV